MAATTKSKKMRTGNFHRLRGEKGRFHSSSAAYEPSESEVTTTWGRLVARPSATCVLGERVTCCLEKSKDMCLDTVYTFLV